MRLPICNTLTLKGRAVMSRAWWVFGLSLLLIALTGACISSPEEENMELKPTLNLTPYATITPTPSATPIQPPTPTPSATPETIIYKIKSGDTLGGIAARYGISTRELMALNGLSDGDLLTVGLELRVPKR